MHADSLKSTHASRMADHRWLRTGRGHEDLAPHAVLHVVAEQHQLLRAVPHAARVRREHRLRQRLSSHEQVCGGATNVLLCSRLAVVGSAFDTGAAHAPRVSQSVHGATTDSQRRDATSRRSAVSEGDSGGRGRTCAGPASPGPGTKTNLLSACTRGEIATAMWSPWALS